MPILSSHSLNPLCPSRSERHINPFQGGDWSLASFFMADEVAPRELALALT